MLLECERNALLSYIRETLSHLGTVRVLSLDGQVQATVATCMPRSVVEEALRAARLDAFDPVVEPMQDGTSGWIVRLVVRADCKTVAWQAATV